MCLKKHVLDSSNHEQDNKVRRGKPKSELKDSVKAWAEGYDKKKWQMMASKHFDKTGERITPDQARNMAEGK